MTKEELIIAIQKCAERLGHAPSCQQFRRYQKSSMYPIEKHFGCWRQALAAAGMQSARVAGRVPMRLLAEDWATTVRKLGKLPSMAEYEEMGRYSMRPLITRYGSWKQVPAGMQEYIIREGMMEDWKDVLDIITEYQEQLLSAELEADVRKVATLKSRIWHDRPIYGPPLTELSLSHGPSNEMGVVFLFGMMARELGFVVTHIQSEFPDCEAMREVDPGQWQRVRIEFEFESRNFFKHGHAPKDCDVIVCWRHNWPGCPLDVVELSEALRRKMAVST